MDAQAKKKAYRAKLNAQKLEKRIDSPLVRYNESDQPVCRVCDVVLKSESLWPAHQASRKHHEAINNLKANAAGRSQINNIKAEPSIPLAKPKREHSTESHIDRHEPSVGSSEPQASSVLPQDFFDNPEAKRRKNGTDATKSGYSDSHKNIDSSPQTQGIEADDTDNKFGELSGPKVVETKIDDIQHAGLHTKTSQMTSAVSETKQVKGALPEGFFDDKDADLRARGITPVKLDIKDEYKEFEKLIQEDLQEVDNRLEEEEYDAAETIEEFESLEQRSRRERVEMLKKKKTELKAAARSRRGGHEVKEEKKVSRDEKAASSDDDSDDDDDDFAVDWRAKRL